MVSRPRSMPRQPGRPSEFGNVVVVRRPAARIFMCNRALPEVPADISAGPAPIIEGQQRMAKSAASLSPTLADFEALLEESYGTAAPVEGSVVKGKVVAVENEYAIIDVGLKMEG